MTVTDTLFLHFLGGFRSGPSSCGCGARLNFLFYYFLFQYPAVADANLIRGQVNCIHS